MKPDPIEILSELVTIASVNPMGRSVSGPPFFEDRLTDFLEKLLGRFGLSVARQTVAPHRDNLVARLEGRPSPEHGGRVLLLDAHQDTVPVDGMKIEPFTPKVCDGRLYGRGACDTKGGMAAMLTAVARLAQDRLSEMPTVLISCTVNEEYGFTGARALTELWAGGPSGIMPRRPDAAVIAEPTGLDVVVAHKGVVRWKCHTAGRACHSAQPEAGENAIYKMAPVLAAIEAYARHLVGNVASHPLCGPATLSVGTIRGGVSVNTVPDRCSIEIDRRLPPGELPQAARQRLIDHLAENVNADVMIEHDPPLMEVSGLSDEKNGPLAEALAAVARQSVGECRRVGVPYGTNAAFYSAAGVPAVVFGPGSLDQAHTDDEWISLEQVEQAAEIYYRFCRSFT